MSIRTIIVLITMLCHSLAIPTGYENELTGESFEQAGYMNPPPAYSPPAYSPPAYSPPAYSPTAYSPTAYSSPIKSYPAPAYEPDHRNLYYDSYGLMKWQMSANEVPEANYLPSSTTYFIPCDPPKYKAGTKFWRSVDSMDDEISHLFTSTWNPSYSSFFYSFEKAYEKIKERVCEKADPEATDRSNDMTIEFDVDRKVSLRKSEEGEDEPKRVCTRITTAKKDVGIKICN